MRLLRRGALVLLADEHAAVSIALDTAAINTSADRVGVRVKAFRVCVTLCPILFSHAGSAGVMGDPHPVGAVVLRGGAHGEKASEEQPGGCHRRR